ncbi:MAG TPA: MFS transporter [Trebonia sp.]
MLAHRRSARAERLAGIIAQLSPDLSPIKLGLVFCGWGILVAIFAVFGAPWLQSRLGIARTMYLNLSVFALMSLGIAVWTLNRPALIILVIASGIVCGVNNTVTTQAVMTVSPVERPVASAAYSFVRFIGGGLAPYVAGRLVADVNIHVPFYVGAGRSPRASSSCQAVTSCSARRSGSRPRRRRRHSTAPRPRRPRSSNSRPRSGPRRSRATPAKPGQDGRPGQGQGSSPFPGNSATRSAALLAVIKPIHVTRGRAAPSGKASQLTRSPVCRPERRRKRERPSLLARAHGASRCGMRPGDTGSRQVASGCTELRGCPDPRLPG